MVLLDSNIVIYASQAGNADLRQFIRTHDPVVSIVSYIEAFGFHNLVEEERLALEDLFQDIEVLRLSNEIANVAVDLRQQRRIGLGDAIIAATALVHDRTLLTRNTSDFRWIDGLELQDPMGQQD